MAGVGRAPQENYASKKKRQPNEIVQGTEFSGYDLPEGFLTDRQGEPIDWHPATVLWWSHWRQSPQATKMITAPDWDFLLDTAVMHHAMWTNKRWELASEVRLRVAKFGATPEDRARLRLEIHTNKESSVGVEGDSSNVTSITSRRRRLRDG